MTPEIYAAVLAFLGQPASSGESSRSERRSSSKARGFRIAKESSTEAERPEENESLRVALEQRDAIRASADRGWAYLREQARLHSNAVPFVDPIQGGDSLVSAVALKWLTHRDVELRDRLLGQAPQELVPQSRPESRDQLDRAALWLTACRRSGRLSLSETRRLGIRILNLVQESGPGSPGRSPAWDVGVSAHLLEPILLAVRHGETVRSMEPIEAMQRQVENHLVSQEYLNGTHAYPSPEIFLCQVSELWRTTTPYSCSLRRPLEAAVRDRWWSSAGPVQEPLHRRALALAALMIAAENLHLSEINLNKARQELARLQSSEGAFSPSPYRRHKGSYLGTRAITTLFAVRALEGQPRTGGWGPGRQWSRPS